MKTINTVIFYILSFTWGIIMSMAGVLGSLAMLLCGKKPKIYFGRIFFEIGYTWGGLNLGPFSFVGRYALDRTKKHENGHGLQNTIYGPFMPFVVSIPSAVRYWLYEFAKKGKLFTYEVGLLFAVMIFILACVISILCCQIVLFFMFAILAFYMCIISGWIIFREGKKFIKKPYPYYESIWFEKQATELGEKYF